MIFASNSALNRRVGALDAASSIPPWPTSPSVDRGANSVQVVRASAGSNKWKTFFPRNTASNYNLTTRKLFRPNIVVPWDDAVLPAWNGGDLPVAIVDRIHGTVHSLYQAYQAYGMSYCTSYAVASLTGSGLAGSKPVGTRAGGCSNLAGLITAEDLAAGSINHALVCAMPAPLMSSNYVSPAFRTDTVGSHGRIDAGSRWALPQAFDEMGLPAGLVMLVRALKAYGTFVMDNCGGGARMLFYAERGIDFHFGYENNAQGAMQRIVDGLRRTA